jgi:hypothetical protein
MWRRTAFFFIAARSPLILRDTGPPSPHRSPRGSSSARHGTSNSSSNAVVDRTPQATETAASPSSSSSATLSTQVSTVEQLKEMARRTQHTLRSQDDALQLLQQKLTLMERRVGLLENTAEDLRGKLSEVHRVVGEVVMRQRNTDLLIQQLERQQLSMANSSDEGDAAKKGRKEDSNTDGNAEEHAASPVTTSSSAPSRTQAGAPCTTPVSSSTSSADATLSHQVSLLEARLDQLTVELFSADRIDAVSNRSNTRASSPTSSCSSSAATALATILTSANTPAKRAALIRALQRQHAIAVFTDATGVTRVTSQCVRVHNVPLNMGAAEVREMCVQHVCKGDCNGLVSCMVRRAFGEDDLSGHRTTSTAASPSQKAQSAGGQPVFTSELQQRNAQHKAGGGAVAHGTPSDSAADANGGGSGNGDDVTPASVSALPCGDVVAAIQPNTKSFEVVFASSALAVRALTVLNRVQLRPTPHAVAIPLAVEPVVSADVLTSLHAMEVADRDAAKNI